MKSWEWMILFREGWSEKQKLQNDACKVFKGWPQKKTKKKHFGKKSLERAVSKEGKVNNICLM